MTTEDILRQHIEDLRSALTELRDRIKSHPAYADLTVDEEIEIGGDTAEFSYLARVADDALGAQLINQPDALRRRLVDKLGLMAGEEYRGNR